VAFECILFLLFLLERKCLYGCKKNIFQLGEFEYELLQAYRAWGKKNDKKYHYSSCISARLFLEAENKKCLLPRRLPKTQKLLIKQAQEAQSYSFLFKESRV